MKQILILGISISSKNQEYLRSYFSDPRFLVEFRDTSLLSELTFLVNSDNHDICLLLERDTWFGPQLAEALPGIIESYNSHFKCWGIASNAGTLWTGEEVSFRRLAPLNPRNQNSPRICLTVDEPLLLINVQALRQANVNFPLIFAGKHGIGTVLSTCCLEHGLLSFVDKRLFAAHHPLLEDDLKLEPLERYAELVAFLNSRYLNHRFTVREQALELATTNQHYEYLELPPPQSSSDRARVDIISLYDKALKNAQLRKTRLEIVTRTVLSRHALLERAISVAQLAHFEADDALDLHFRLVSDRDPSLLNNWTAEFQERYPGLRLSCSSFKLRNGRFSRTDMLLQAIETSEADFIWFIDDDDFVFPSSLIAIGRALCDRTPRALIGPSVVYQEQWNAQQTVLKSFTATGRFLKEGVLKVVSGENYIPICSMILPVTTMKEIVGSIKGTGDYLEDYLLLLSYLPHPTAQFELLETHFAGISIRGEENTVRKLNRSHWEFSYAQVFEELLSNQAIGLSPFTVFLGRQYV